ncbi:MAG TPA: hypothetical protein VKE96_05690 [Vicinamibacterales bacterium]|nr:hypothetical protein [Vicinamibacterales bacterium]
MDETTATDKHCDGRKPYVKPQIHEVPLRPDEAVLAGCKTSSTSGAGQHRCTNPTTCSALTS